MRVQIGYLPAGQTCTVDIQLLQTMNIFGGSYCYKLPFGLYPDYDKHRAPGGQKSYEFDYTA